MSEQSGSRSARPIICWLYVCCLSLGGCASNGQALNFCQVRKETQSVFSLRPFRHNANLTSSDEFLLRPSINVMTFNAMKSKRWDQCHLRKQMFPSDSRSSLETHCFSHKLVHNRCYQGQTVSKSSSHLKNIYRAV